MGTKDLLYTRNKVHFKEGDIIFKEDEEDCKEMYVIDSGRVNIVKKVGDTDVTLTTLDEGDFFGEMVLFGETSRTATVTTTKDSTIVVINEELFN